MSEIGKKKHLDCHSPLVSDPLFGLDTSSRTRGLSQLLLFCFSMPNGVGFSWCEATTYDTMNATNLLESLRPNQQCEILWHGQLEQKRSHEFVDRSVNASICARVSDLLQSDWDWVSPNSSMLTAMILGNRTALTVAGHQNSSRKGSVVDFTEATAATIRDRSSFDVELYRLFADQ